MNKWLLVLVLISPAVISAGSVSEEPVYIPDASLKAAIERTLDISEPNQTEMLNLTSLRAEGIGIVDLTGLEYATNLTALHLKGNEIHDISVLYGLHMNDADLSGNRIRELPEQSMTTESLLLYNNEIEDIRGIYESHILDHRPNIILWEGNRDPNITPPPLYVRDEDNNPIVLPETVRDKIYEFTLDFFYQNIVAFLVIKN
jgi:Leucine-rich repeat (LRR) protein